MRQKNIVVLLTKNQPGVLVGVAGLIAQHGFNIDSLTLSETLDKQYSRMTLVVRGDSPVAQHVIDECSKMEQVLTAVLLDDEDVISGELMLIKVMASPAERANVHKIAYTYHATVVNIGQSTMTLQTTTSPEELDELITHLEKQGIVELVRTGLTTLQKGDQCLTTGEKPL